MGYEWGRAGKLRAMRDYLGVGREEMAGLLHIAPRSYERIEAGISAISVSMWDDIEHLLQAHDDEVAAMVAAAAGKASHTVIMDWGDSAWRRTIVARARRQAPHIVPVLPDGIAALEEKDGGGKDLPDAQGVRGEDRDRPRQS